jgi:amidase
LNLNFSLIICMMSRYLLYPVLALFYGLAAHAMALPTAAQQTAPRRVEIVEATIPQLQEAMSRGEVTAVELVDAYLARIAAYDQQGPGLSAIIRINPDARAEAALLDRERAQRGPRGPLHGIPVILKDNYDTADMPTTAGSVALAGSVPPDDAFQVRKLREAGAIILAKSNLHELAAGITTISSLGGQTRNPYDPRRNAGGSSGGTGAAVAANFGVIGWGSDTCGSIRIPAAVNNLFGLRPTKGLSSIDGIIPLAHTQDVGGPLARTATDLAIALDATIGPDPADPATQILEGRPLPVFTQALDTTALRSARIGVLEVHFGSASDERETSRVVRAALDTMKARGAEIVQVEVPRLDSLLEGSSLIGLEFKWDLMDYLAQIPGAPVSSLGEILERGLYHVELEQRFRERNRVESRDSKEYRAALEKRAATRDAVLRVMEEQRLDALAYPTIRRTAAIIGEPALGANCQLSATTGMPALSIPAGFTSDGMPVGLELLGRPLDDARLVGLGYAFEQITDHRRSPVLAPPLENGSIPAPITFEVTATGAERVPATRSPVEAQARFTIDRARNSLSYDVRVSGVEPGQVHAVTLHRGKPGEHGPVLHRLSGPGITQAAGALDLSGTDRDALLGGEVYLQVYTRDHPAGAARAQLKLPGSVS